MAEEEWDFDSPKSSDKRSIKQKNKKKKQLLMEGDSKSDDDDASANKEKQKKKKDLFVEEQEVNRVSVPVEGNSEVNGKSADSRKDKMKKRKRKRKKLLEESAKTDKRGICYLSRIPPRMDFDYIRTHFSQYGEVERLYLAPQNDVHSKRAVRFQQQKFSEGWVEFTDKRVAKRVANMLNGEQIGGKKRSSFYYDLWNIKYLSKFKWADLNQEIGYKNAIREQKLALEISAAKRERDFYLSKVDKSRALSSIEERLQKKQKVQQESVVTSNLPVSQQAAKVIRQFPQKQPVANNAGRAKPRLSKDILAGVFRGS